MLATVLFGVAIAGTPILAQTVTIDYDHSVNFLKFKTYTWDRVHATDPGVEGRITIAVDRDMSGRYMSQASKNGDVTIAVVEATQDKKEYSDFYAGLNNPTWQRGWGSGGFLDTAATLQDVPLDTLVMDIYDTKTQKLIWRGVVTEPVVKSAEKNDQTMDKAVNLLFAKFPPKFVKTK
jgi:hypothetical protein